MLDKVRQRSELPEDVFRYLLRLGQKDLDRFQRNWALLESYEVKDSKSLVDILRMSVKYLSVYQPDDVALYEETFRFFKRNIGVWESQAISWIRNRDFNSQDLSLSLWAYAKLGIEPSSEFMKAWERHAIEKIENKGFNSQDLSLSLWAYAKIRNRAKFRVYEGMGGRND